MSQEKILRLPQVIEVSALSSATIARQEKIGLFPRRRRIGLRAVGWLESEIQEWLAKKAPKSKHYGALIDIEGYDSSPPNLKQKGPNQ